MIVDASKKRRKSAAKTFSMGFLFIDFIQALLLKENLGEIATELGINKTYAGFSERECIRPKNPVPFKLKHFHPKLHNESSFYIRCILPSFPIVYAHWIRSEVFASFNAQLTGKKGKFYWKLKTPILFNWNHFVYKEFTCWSGRRIDAFDSKTWILHNEGTWKVIF